MAITLSGDGVVTGVTALPDGLVTNDDLAGSIAEGKLAGSIPVSKIATTGSATSSTFLSGTGAWAAAGGGKILSITSSTKTDTFSSATGSAWTDITDMTVTTPTLASTSSKVLVTVNLGEFINHTGHVSWKIVDGAGSDITGFIGDAGGSRSRSTTGSFYSNSMPGGAGHNASMTVLDNVTGATTARTYKLQFFQAGGGTLYMNRSHSDSDNSQNYRSISTITAMEIGA